MSEVTGQAAMRGAPSAPAPSPISAAGGPPEAADLPRISAGTGGAPRGAAAVQKRSSSFALAVVAHLLLLALLFFGVRWQTQKPVAVQAELWEPPAVKPPTPTPRLAPAPAPPPPRPIEPPAPPEVKPDIAIEKARQERERQQREDAERLRQQQLAQEKAAQERKEAEAKKIAEAKAAEEKRHKAEETRKIEEARKAEEARKVEEARKAAEAKKIAEAKAAEEKRRNDYLARLQAEAGAGEPRNTPRAGAAVGGAAGGLSGAAEGAWGAKVSSAIQANTIYAIPPELNGNPKASFAVNLMPDCSIASVRMTRSSGVASWDQAAERAIRRTDPVPRPPNGQCPTSLAVNSGPRDAR